MKLIITRKQAKGMLGMGSVTFEVQGHVQLTTEEAELVKHYGLEKEIVAHKPLRILGRETGQAIQVSVRNLVAGDVFKAKDLSEVIGHTENLVEACKNLKTYIEVARTFGGQEVIDI